MFNPFSRPPIMKVWVRLVVVTVNVGPGANSETLTHFQTPEPAVPPPVTALELVVKPTPAKPFTKVQSKPSVGFFTPKPLP